MPDGKRTIIVDDDFLIVEYLRYLCEEFQVEVVGTAMNANEAIGIIRSTRPDYALLDVRLGGDKDGIDVARILHEERPTAKVIFITGSSETSTISRIQADHPFRTLIKPINPDDLRQALDAGR